jgi:GH15 family glucan-1,4-alpha-glucosidase
MASRIEDYGMVGDMQTAAIISRGGSVDWMCAPFFDSDACFASLIGYDRHGCWAIRPTVRIRETRQRYEGDSLVLVTEFICDEGTVRCTDFMPMNQGRSDLVRRIEGVRGEVPLEMVLVPRFGYGADLPWVRTSPQGIIFTSGGNSLRLHASIPIQPSRDEVRAYFTLRAGQRADFQLGWHPSHHPSPPALDVNQEHSRTRDFWTGWAAHCNYQGRYRDAVVRSLLTLKALTFAATGGIVAAPTCSLPEEIGGSRNWDYRFCWLRDATLILEALLFGGYVEEAAAFREWMMRATAGAPDQIQIMYNIWGGRRLTEFELTWLPGYEGSQPVRVGNAAASQFQLDIYGEVLNALYLGRRQGLHEVTDGWPVGSALLRNLEKVWQEPDEGIWEVRGGRKHFTYSKVMAWVAADRAVRIIEEFNLGREEGQALLPRLRALRVRIHDEVCERGYNPRVRAFTQSYGSTALDASVLLMTHMGFLPPSDPRMQSTVEAVERHLLRDGFVLRYNTEDEVDGLAGTEGAFLACSFWLADNYVFAGRTEEGRKLFERLLGLSNHLGLLAEEYEPRLGRQIGNFPQGFSHLAVISTARYLDQNVKTQMRPEQAHDVVPTQHA